MNRNVKFDSFQNPAMNFGMVVSDLEKTAKETRNTNIKNY